MTSRAVLLSAALLLVASGCYGRASPASCHKKYVRDGRGDEEDNYERCLARYEAGLAAHDYRNEKRRLKTLRVSAETARLQRELAGLPTSTAGKALTCYPQADGSLSCTPQ